MARYPEPVPQPPHWDQPTPVVPGYPGGQSYATSPDWRYDDHPVSWSDPTSTERGTRITYGLIAVVALLLIPAVWMLIAGNNTIQTIGLVAAIVLGLSIPITLIVGLTINRPNRPKHF